MNQEESTPKGQSGRPEFISLFSGCGGLDLGLVHEGFKCAAAVDIDELALQVHRQNIDGKTFARDLTTGELPAELPSKVDVVIAGSPCQGFSTLGKRNLDDPRNQLLISGAQAALSRKPKVFIAENVVSVKSGEHGRFWSDMKSLWSGAGYRTNEIVIDSRNLGLPQSRRRVFLVAWNTKAVAQIQQPSIKHRTLRGFFLGVEQAPNHNPDWLTPGSDELRIAMRIKPGHKLSDVRSGPSVVHTWDIPEVYGALSNYERLVLEEIGKLRRRIRVRSSGDADPLPRIWAEFMFGKSTIARLVSSGHLREIDAEGPCIDLRFGFNGKFRRLSWDSCATTVDTRFCNPNYNLHPDENRGLSTREAARLQGFPDNFVFSGTRHDHVLIGNAVPPPVAAYLARFVREELLA